MVDTIFPYLEKETKTQKERERERVRGISADNVTYFPPFFEYYLLSEQENENQKEGRVGRGSIWCLYSSPESWTNGLQGERVALDAVSINWLCSQCMRERERGREREREREGEREQAF